jgi:nicotinamidase-related amidase
MNINQLTTDNTAFVFIDHQPWVAFPVQSIDPATLVNNVTGLAKVAVALEIPTVLTTINATSGVLKDPLFQQLVSVFPDLKPIDRHNTNAWSNADFVKAVQATGRKNLVMSGLWTEVCLAQTVLSALKDDFSVIFVSDCSGGISNEAHADAKSRMIQAGAIPMTWQAVMAELCPDNTAPAYANLYAPAIEHGGGVGLAVQYYMANMNQ